jgi:AcrR family transcriptional regulator
VAKLPQRLPGALRREQIARAALEIIGRQGLVALTVTALAEAVGVTSGALFRHFATREAILEEAVRSAEARLAATLPPEEAPPLVRLRKLATARVRLLRAEPGIAWLLRSEQAALCLPAPAVARLRGMVVRTQGVVRDALAEAVSSGEVRGDIEPDTLRIVFTSTVHALVGQGQRPRRGRLPSIERALSDLFRMFAPPGDVLGNEESKACTSKTSTPRRRSARSSPSLP